MAGQGQRRDSGVGTDSLLARNSGILDELFKRFFVSRSG
jgi:hypothetical protein